MNSALCQPLIMLNIHPVLLDVGAAGPQPKIWQSIARQCRYVGFDPDHRELRPASKGTFYDATIVDEAVTDDEASEVLFYLTKSPYCSSRLKPDSKSLESFLFSDLFVVERETRVRATNLNEALRRLNLLVVDWIKLDTQGTDLRLFQSLRPETRNHVLALDIEPGLIDAYQGEDLFVEAHKELTHSGFWLSSIEIHGAIRMRRSTLEYLAARTQNLSEAMIAETAQKSPGWCEARYFRTIESLGQIGVSQRDYVLLWLFALLDRHFGVALDLAVTYEKTFGSDPVSGILMNEPLRQIQRGGPLKWFRRSKSLVPERLKRTIRRLVR
jgi:FkbM family methyltransferase